MRDRDLVLTPANRCPEGRLKSVEVRSSMRQKPVLSAARHRVLTAPWLWCSAPYGPVLPGFVPAGWCGKRFQSGSTPLGCGQINTPISMDEPMEPRLQIVSLGQEL